MAGSQDYAADPRNEGVLIYLNGALVPRADARVSIFDSGFSMGDGVWEGLRLHKGSLLFLDAHLDRLFAGLDAIGMAGQLTREGVADALRAVLTANDMTDGAHLRLMITRGLKSAINQDPRNALGTPTLAITAEYKAPPTSAPKGLALATALFGAGNDFRLVNADDSAALVFASRSTGEEVTVTVVEVTK